MEEAFVQLWKNRGEFRAMVVVRSYLYTCTRNACLNVRKMDQRREARHEAYGQMQGRVERFALEEMVEAEVMAGIYRAIDELPEKMRNVFRLSYIEGLSNQEVADKAGVSINTVKKQKADALEVLRKKLGPREMMVISLLVMGVAVSE